RFQHGKVRHSVATSLDAMVRTEHWLASENIRARGLDDVTANRRIVFLQRGSATGKRAARADKIAERIDGAARLRENLRPGVQQVCAVVATVPKLIGAKCAAFSYNPLGFDFHLFK